MLVNYASVYFFRILEQQGIISTGILKSCYISAAEHIYFLSRRFPKIGMSDWATVNEKMSLGPTTKIFGVNPLKNEPNPSFATISLIIENPPWALARDLA